MAAVTIDCDQLIVVDNIVGSITDHPIILDRFLITFLNLMSESRVIKLFVLHQKVDLNLLFSSRVSSKKWMLQTWMDSNHGTW